MPRVLLLVTDLRPGGTPLRIARLARALPAYDFVPVVGCLAARGPLSDVLEAAGIETFDCGAGHRRDAAVALGRLASRIRRLNPDLVHATLFHANIAARLVGRLDRPRPIVTGSATIEVERWWHRVGESMTHGLSDWHVANSHAVARHLRDDLGFPVKQIVVIPNAVDVAGIRAAAPIDRRDVGLTTDRPLLIWAGRMDRVKRVEMLIEALDVARRETAFSLVIAGDGPERACIEALIASRSWAPDVRFAGWVSDLPRWLKAADGLVLTSLTEGMPNVVLEAMAAGCCVVASDIPACRELITHGQTGILAEGQDPSAFGRAILRLLADPDGRSRMADAAARFVQCRFRVEKIARQLSGFYEQILANKAS